MDSELGKSVELTGPLIVWGEKVFLSLLLSLLPCERTLVRSPKHIEIWRLIFEIEQTKERLMKAETGYDFRLETDFLDVQLDRAQELLKGELTLQERVDLEKAMRPPGWETEAHKSF